MINDKIFLSYSRLESDFAIRLSQDLKKNGVKIWFDQIDIKAGHRWDASIEEALNSAPIILVILTPSSISSNNVMDEVSYALENGKTVIPILLIDCVIPFRLRRLQRADFTKDYKKGLSQLEEVLIRQKTEDYNVPDKYTDEYNKKESSKNITKSPEKIKKYTNLNKSLFKYLLIGGIIVLLIASTILITKQWNHKKEVDAWYNVSQKDDSVTCMNFIKNFPNSKYLKSVQIKLDSIRTSKKYIKSPISNNEEQTAGNSANHSTKNYTEESNAWVKAVATDDLNGYYAYCRSYPSGLHLAEAKRMIDSIEQMMKRQNHANKSPIPKIQKVDKSPAIKEPVSYSVSFKLAANNNSFDVRLKLTSMDLYVDDKYVTTFDFTRVNGDYEVIVPSGIHKFAAKSAYPLYKSEKGDNWDINAWSEINIQSNAILYIGVEIYKPDADWTWTPRWISFSVK